MERQRRPLLVTVATLVALVTFLALSLTAQGEISDPIKITLFHTNDEHGWLETYAAYGSPLTEGGVANLMGRWTGIEGYDPTSDGFLVLSAGDMWTGPSISTWFEGEPVVEVMNAMGYDAAAIGNHEFDFGRDALNDRIAEADFPLLAANIYYTDTTNLADFATPFTVKQVNGVDVGIIGLSTTSTPSTTHPKNISDLTFGDYEQALRREVPNARAQGADVIVVVGHVCSSELATLAAAVSDLDIALMQGGHCHGTTVDQVGDTLIIEAHWAWRAYGKSELFLDPVTFDVVTHTHQVVLNQYVTDDGNPVTPDPDVEDIVEYWQTQTDAVMGEVIGYSDTGLARRSWKQVNYVMDSWLWAYGTADFAVSNWGGFRADIDAGDITVGDVVGVLPFENRIVDCAITGAQIVENLEACGGAIAGFNYTYHMADGQTVVDAMYLPDGTPLDLSATYHVLVNDFMYAGGDDCLYGQHDPTAYDTGIQWRQPVIDWTREQMTSETNPIDPLIDDEPRATELDGITLFHTNDEHGWLETFEAYRSPITEGGVANLMGRWTEIEGYDPAGDGFLVLSAGDMWTGPSISTWFEGEPVVEVMNAMGYDAAAIGNHEFDFGRDALNDRIAEADFPFLAANIYYTDTSNLADFATPFTVKQVNGVDVGIIGLSTTSTPVTTHPKNISDLTFGDYEQALRREVPNARAQGADVIVVVGHVCSSELATLAAAVSDLDIALMQGGHCHGTTVDQVGDTLIIEAHWAWRAYGKSELFLDPVTFDVVPDTHQFFLNQYVTDDGNPVTPDPDVEDIVEYWQTQTDAVMGEVIGYSDTGLPRRSWKQVNYIMDSWLWAYGTADFAVSNWGGFRADIDAGDITVGDIVGVLPFENRIVDCAITGAQLIENLEACGGAGAGFTYTYHTRSGQTVVEAVTLTNGSPLDLNATYHVLVNDFMYAGGDDCLYGQHDPNAYDTGIQWRQPVIDWTREQNTSETSPIDPLIDDAPRSTAIERYYVFLPVVFKAP